MRITPFGLPVDPEVYWRNATSSGVRATGASVPPLSARSAKVTTRFSVGTWPFRSVPSGFASGTVTSSRASALVRTPACRRM